MRSITTAHIISKIAIVLSIAFLFLFMVYWPETMPSYATAKISATLENNPTNEQLMEIAVYANRAIGGTSQASIVVGRAVIVFVVFMIFCWGFCAYEIRRTKQSLKKEV